MASLWTKAELKAIVIFTLFKLELWGLMSPVMGIEIERSDPQHFCNFPALHYASVMLCNGSVTLCIALYR